MGVAAGVAAAGLPVVLAAQDASQGWEQAVKTTIQWFKDHGDWWRAIKSGEYLKYYETQYAGR